MSEPINGQNFAGPHPTCRQFVAQLIAWGFTSIASALGQTE